MKSTFLLFLLLFNSLSEIRKNPNDFDSDLDTIAHKFIENIMDKEECEKQKRNADDLAEEIEKALKNEDDYNNEEKSQLKKLKKEAEALEDYIGTIGDTGNYFLNMNTFYLANGRIGASYFRIGNYNFCVDVVVVEIKDYKVYLFQNNTENNYFVEYNYKVSNTSKGSGKMGVNNHSMRNFYNNRENPKFKNVTVLGISCKEF